MSGAAEVGAAMDEVGGGGRNGSATEELILRMVALHAASLLRTARRHSLCADDAQDAYQRTLELFMAHAERLDPVRAAGWLHVVVKREAHAIRTARKQLVSHTVVEVESPDARCVPSPEDQLFAFDLVKRSAEALQRLKPQELQALWLKAQGNSYSEIGAITGWSYTKVNRCITEGRRSFLERYAAIESGAECARWLPVISALVDGEATPAQLLELRPHLRNCPGCRATLRALQDSTEPLAAVLPIALMTGGALPAVDAAEPVASLLLRTYEAVVGPVKHHVMAAYARVVDPTPLAAVRPGATAAAVAGCLAVGSGATYCVEQGVDPVGALSSIVAPPREHKQPKMSRKQAAPQRPAAPSSTTPAVAPVAPPPQPTPPPPPVPPPAPTPAQEFEPTGYPVGTAASAQPSPTPQKPAPAPADGPGEFDGP